MADINSLMEMPWAKRAMDSTTPTLTIEGAVGMPIEKATVQTMSSEYKGKEILYPTIRMIDGELEKLTDKEAMDLAIKKDDYVEYNSPEEATKASKELSNFIGFARDPKGTMEREEKEYQEQMANLPFGNVSDFISGLKGYPLKPDEDEGIMYEPFKSRAQILGSDTRNTLKQSVSFMMLYNYFNPEKRED